MIFSFIHEIFWLLEYTVSLENRFEESYSMWIINNTTAKLKYYLGGATDSLGGSGLTFDF